MLRNGLELTLIDFGCATRDLLTSSKDGNMANMAPEIVVAPVGVTTDQSKTDVWATGCLVYELLGLEHPFTGVGPHKFILHPNDMKDVRE